MEGQVKKDDNFEEDVAKNIRNNEVEQKRKIVSKMYWFTFSLFALTRQHHMIE